MNDLYYIRKISSEIEKKLQWKSISQWTDHDYRKLSQLILEETTISISHQTLKRLFGKLKYKESHTPQPATKDALAIFIGYKDWPEFVSAENNRIKNSSKYKFDVKTLKRYQIPIISGVLIILIIAVISFYSSKTVEVEFNASNLYGTAPHTVSFKYDVSKLKNKNVFIDFDQHEAEDTLSKEKLDKNRHLINHCFETPGFYNVCLWVDNKVQSNIKVHVISDGWDSYYFNNDNFSLRKFAFPLENRIEDLKKDSLLYISPQDLSYQGFKSNSIYYLEHQIFKNFEISADSSVLEVKYKNSPETGGFSCFDVEFRIIGENGLVSVILVQKGCYRWSEVTVGDVHINGKYSDLTRLSTDMTSWNIMHIKVNDFKALFINGEDTIYSCSYKQPIGKIKGIRFVTKGSGAFDYVKLLNTQRTLKFKDDFEN